MQNQTRKCRSCGHEKNILAGFYRARKDPTLPSSYSYECKICARARTSNRSPEQKERMRDLHYQRKYGISLSQYNLMLEEQDFKCRSCGEPHVEGHRNTTLAVDHDHNTNEVRGLLCRRCNMVLGEVGDNIQTLRNMVAYLNG